MKTKNKTRKPRQKEPPLTDWQKYEQQKKRLQGLRLMPEAYTRKMRKITDEIGI